MAVAAALGLTSVFGLAHAQPGQSGSPGERPPKGPYVNFCPTPDQVEAHLAEYGFDYKPTVACTAEGQIGPSSSGEGAPDPGSAEEANNAAMAREKAFLKGLTPGVDADGDPTTLEGIGPDGQEVVIFVQTTQPERFEGMTPAEFAEQVYP
ncbi:MAG: hypothetical protein M3N53_13115 [Actinomycetota bacterium]|nr:hypothetical protein [Actinomycetota bacterium]